MDDEDFTVDFNFTKKPKETSDWEPYRHFIERLRSRLGVRFSHDCPVLHEEVNPPTRWFDVVLRTDTNNIRLRIRRDNLYLVAYQMQNSDEWLEFGSDTTTPPSVHLIDGSTFLGFNGNYDGLNGASDEPTDRISLGQPQLADAVNNLAITEDRNTRARSLIIVIQMICESIRFARISDLLATTFRYGTRPPAWMLELEHGWEDLSAALLRADDFPEHFFRLRQPNDMGIVTAMDAVAALGIMKGFWYRPRPPRMAVVVNDIVQESPRLGRPLVEVFWVRINKIDGENPGQLYGTITVTDGLGCQYIYKRNKDDCESVKPGHNALLTGPPQYISAYGRFTIDLDLFDYDRWSPDDQVSKGKISWDVFNTNNEYDKLSSVNVDGKYGSATVSYVVLSDAVQAVVEVTLIDGDDEDPADVYGDITARNSCFMNESVLFRKASNEHIDVRPGKLIPLSRSVAAVPSNSYLIVRANLYDHDTVSSDDEIANGTAEFPTQLSGTSEKNIKGKNGEIRVKVTWIN